MIIGQQFPRETINARLDLSPGELVGDHQCQDDQCGTRTQGGGKKFEGFDRRKKDLPVPYQAEYGSCSHVDRNSPEDIHRADNGGLCHFIFQDQPQIYQHQEDVTRIKNTVDGKQRGHVVEVKIHEETPEFFGPAQVHKNGQHGPHHQQKAQENGQAANGFVFFSFEDIAEGRNDDGPGAEPDEVDIQGNQLPPGNDIAVSPDLLAFEVKRPENL